MPPRNVSYLKPRGYKDHLTLVELSRLLSKDPSWLRALEKEGRIPKAARVKRGKLQVRLWSPAQAKEIRAILATHRPGRPSGA
jgi:hypothetical protein